MATGHICRLNTFLWRFSNSTKLRHAQPCIGAAAARLKSTVTGPSLDGSNCKVEIGATSDGKTIVCYHPSVDIPYELTAPIERPDPLTNQAETHDQVLKSHLSKEVLKDKRGPSIEELSKMFFTTKHRWYPVGQYHTRRKKKDSLKDR
ncbi:large ribosomal subunit protein mL42 [Genypterus blacodes]|uniref:large ribosomal subunit protein mL42 n=1 Tax=Genypterus blacodes TaxID=154954 RepID=UPI003F7723DA